ncbi:MAG: S8 family peptidase [Mycobacterium leprae]
MHLPTMLQWVRTDGHRLDSALRHRLFDMHRAPRWLPCWFHPAWHWLTGRLVRIPVIMAVDEQQAQVVRTCRQARGQVVHQLEHLNLVTARMRGTALQKVCREPGVRRVWLDREVHALLDVAVPATHDLKAADRFTGVGVTIAIIDTGIYPHPDLKGRIVAFQDFVGKRTKPYDDNGHGTHVAGCAAGDGGSSIGLYRGPAPAAKLVGVKVLNKIGSGTTSAILAAINWVIANRETYGIRILSMSLGGQAQGGHESDPLCQAVARAWQAGIVCTIAAGNEGPGTGTISTPGIAPQVITVGAMDDLGTADRADDQIAAFSSRGPTPDGLHKPDLLAPGVNITSLRSPKSYLDKNESSAREGQWYFTLSGTSMATPIVAGICAQLLEAEPRLTPDQVKARLMRSAENRGLSIDEQGSGYVDVDRALGL